MADIYCNIRDDDKLEKIGDAFSSPIRRKILRLLCKQSYSVLELAKLTNVALSTMSFHLKILKDAGLINVISSPSKRGNEKNVSQSCANIYISFISDAVEKKSSYSIELPIGSYFDFNISRPCGMMSKNSKIGEMDNIDAFYSPRRSEARLIYFMKGWLEYRISASPFKDKLIKSITFSLELCSECPNYNNEWKSDITFWINKKEICTYRSMGDYGDRRGLLNPDWYPNQSSQYGLLVKIRVDEDGVWINNELVNTSVKINDLEINNNEYLSLKLGNKVDARHIGGMNIYGRGFGDHNQDIIIQISYK